jgi:phosphate transport system protein
VVKVDQIHKIIIGSRFIEALKKRDLETARQNIADDRRINQKRFEIEEKFVQLLAMQ